MIKCPNCGAQNRNRDRYCLTCGTSLKKQIKELERKKELEELKRKKQIQETQEKENTNPNRDFNRRHTRETSKNIKNINQGKIQKNNAKNTLKKQGINILNAEFKPIPILLSALIPGLGFIWYKKWLKTIFFTIISILFLYYLIPLPTGKIAYIIYWVIMIILTHTETN